MVLNHRLVNNLVDKQKKVDSNTLKILVIFVTRLNVKKRYA